MRSTNAILERGKRYHALSVRDLLEARDAYHVFLMRRRNVIGTAIGKYRIRKTGVPETEAKTLENTEIRNYSWPCVIVFVEEWINHADFGEKGGVQNEDWLPQRLYLPDGREIPVCVVKTAWQQKGPDAIGRMKFPGSVIGGGYPVLTKVQGEDRWATLGCLVTDGRLTYALTNAHVAGRPGESLFTMKNGNEEEIGVSAQRQLQKKPFSEVYEDFPGKHTEVNLDIGLVELNDMHGVTSQIFGIEEVKGIVDVNHDTLSLNLIGCPVMGYGCASGMMKGEIVGLFYRYAAAGGYDYVADYLVGPRNEEADAAELPFAPRSGDSGTLLVVDRKFLFHLDGKYQKDLAQKAPSRELRKEFESHQISLSSDEITIDPEVKDHQWRIRISGDERYLVIKEGQTLNVYDPMSDAYCKAIGVLWGGQKDISGKGEQPYGLVTNMGTILRLLDVELVCDWNAGYDRYFGAFAHIVLPSLCASAVKDVKLKKLMENNADRFSMPLGETKKKATKGLSKAEFVPLSDVPDLVWKKRGGDYQRGREGPNHFADMDQPNPEDDGRTLLDWCDNRKNIDPDKWVEYYKQVGVKEMGALPFRIAQIYDAMTMAVRRRRKAEFVCASGILAHYVFDACMPMHISYMHHGDPNGSMKTVKSGGKEKKVPVAYDVHAEFDNQMVEYYVDKISARLPGLVQEKAGANKPVKVDSIKTAKDAAVAAVTLMRNTVRTYADPAAIVKDFEGLVDRSKRARCDSLWEKYGDGLQQAMAEAVVLTARLWEAAWRKGNGKQKIKSTTAVSEGKLKKLYETKDGFLNSVNLQEIKGEMAWN